jgi:hypothetical protein
MGGGKGMIVHRYRRPAEGITFITIEITDAELAVADRSIMDDLKEWMNRAEADWISKWATPDMTGVEDELIRQEANQAMIRDSAGNRRLIYERHYPEEDC